MVNDFHCWFKPVLLQHTSHLNLNDNQEKIQKPFYSLDKTKNLLSSVDNKTSLKW